MSHPADGIEGTHASLNTGFLNKTLPQDPHFYLNKSDVGPVVIPTMSSPPAIIEGKSDSSSQPYP